LRKCSKNMTKTAQDSRRHFCITDFKLSWRSKENEDPVFAS